MKIIKTYQRVFTTLSYNSIPINVWITRSIECGFCRFCEFLGNENAQELARAVGDCLHGLAFMALLRTFTYHSFFAYSAKTLTYIVHLCRMLFMPLVFIDLHFRSDWLCNRIVRSLPVDVRTSLSSGGAICRVQIAKFLYGLVFLQLHSHAFCAATLTQLKNKKPYK